MSGTIAGALTDGLVGVLAAAVLCAGLAKLAVPAATRVAVMELITCSARVASFAVRSLALAEIASAGALLSTAGRRPGAAALMVLGLLFAGAGLAGRVKHATAPCGCYGGLGGSPLGSRNIVLGLLAAVMGGLLGWFSGKGVAAQPAMLAALTAILMCLLVAVLYHPMILAALRSALTPASEGARR